MFGITISPTLLLTEIVVVSAILITILAINAILANRRYKALRADMELLLGQINSALTTMFSVVRKTSGEMDRLFADPANTFGLERLETVRLDLARQKEAVQQIRQAAPTPTFLMREAAPALQRTLRVFEKNIVTMLRQWDSAMEDLQNQPQQLETIAAPPPADDSHLETRLASLQHEYNQLRKMHENLVTSHQQARNTIAELEDQLAQIGNQEAQDALRQTADSEALTLPAQDPDAEVDTRIQAYQQAVQDLEEKMHAQTRTHRQQTHALEAEVATARADLAAMEKLQQRLETLEAQNAELQSMNELLVEDAAQYGAPSENLDDEELYAKYLTALEKQQDLEIEIEALRRSAAAPGVDGDAPPPSPADDDALRHEMERMLQSAGAQEQRLKDLQAQAQQDIDALKAELATKDAALEKLQQARDEADQALNAEKERRRQTQETLNAELQALQDRLEAALQATAAPAEPATPERDQNAATEMIDALRASLQALEVETDELRQALEHTEVERDQLRQELEETRNAMSPHSADDDQTPQPSRRPTQADLEMALAELETIRAAAREETEALLARIAELEAQRDQTDAPPPQGGAAESAPPPPDAAQGDLNNELEAARAQVEDLTRDLEMTRQMFNEDLEALEKNAAEDLQREREEREQERQTGQQAIQALEEKLEAARNAQNRLAEELAETQRKTTSERDAQLVAAREDLEKEQARRQEIAARLESETASLRDQLAEAQERLEALGQEQQASRRQEPDRINTAVADVMKDLQKEQFLRREERQEWEKRQQALEEQISRNDQEKQKIREELDRARQAIKELYPIVRGLEQQNRQQSEALTGRQSPPPAADPSSAAPATPGPHGNDETQARPRAPQDTLPQSTHESE